MNVNNSGARYFVLISIKFGWFPSTAANNPFRGRFVVWKHTKTATDSGANSNWRSTICVKAVNWVGCVLGAYVYKLPGKNFVCSNFACTFLKYHEHKACLVCKKYLLAFLKTTYLEYNALSYYVCSLYCRIS